MMVAPPPRPEDLREGRAAFARFGERMADVHLARFLLRPVDFVDPAHWQALKLAPAVVSAMNRAAPFRRAVNAALADLAIGGPLVEDHAAASLRATREGRLCALLLVAPIEAVDRIAGLIAAAVTSRVVAGLLLSADRRRVRAEMGDEAFDFAVAEAPLMCADLTKLAVGRAADIQTPFADFARHLLIDVVGEIAPPVEPLFRLRFPPTSQSFEHPRLSQRHLDQAVRLILRKEPAWLASID